MTSQTLYMKPHPVWGQHIHVTSQPLSGSSHPLYRQHHTHSFYDITLAIYVASCALYKTSHPHIFTSNHHFEDIIPTILDIMSIVSVSSHQLYHDITATICMISHPEYVRHSVHYIYDIIPTMYDITTLCVDYTTLGLCMTSFALQKTSHPLYHIKPQSLWLHIHFSHDITPRVSDIAPTVSLSSQPLHRYHTHFCVTSHRLYVWHLMHYIYHHIHCLCHHTTVLRTEQTWHMKPHPVYSSKYTLSLWLHSH